MGNRTLVAFYGHKPPELDELIRACLNLLKHELGDCFRPYEMPQIHATIIGLERTPGSMNVSRNYAALRGLQRTMDVPSFLEWLRRAPWFPLAIQVGGFGMSEEPFLSRSRVPYERSFSIQAEKVVLIGWPVAPNGAPQYPPSLDQIRRGGQQFGILHLYHRRESDMDNDFYLRLGCLAAPLDNAERDRVEKSARGGLANRRATIVPVELSDLQLVEYTDESLPPDSTRVVWTAAD